MSRCGHTEHLEALVMGELHGAEAHELRAHAEHCSRCRHELNWLETERMLFRARAADQQVSTLINRADQRRRFVQVALAAVASLLLTTGMVKILSLGPSSNSASDASISFSESAFEPEVETAESRDVPVGCSRLPEGVGFHCTSPASFLAIR